MPGEEWPAPSSRQSPALSEAPSSGLSEPEEAPEEPKTQDAAPSEDEDLKDNDTEAETERLHPTPNKHSRRAEDAHFHGVVLDSGPNMRRPPPEGILTTSDPLPADIPDDELPNEIGASTSPVKSPKELAGVKRKRSSSLSEAEVSSLPSLERQSLDGSRRSSGQGSADLNASPQQRLAEREGDVDVEAEQMDAECNAEDDEPVNNEPEHPLDGMTSLQDLSKGPVEEDMGMPEPVAAVIEDNEQAIADNVDEEDHAAAENEDEEAEATAKSNDEMAKRKAAVEALMPIEKQFAILRDKLYDERLESLSAELDLLNQPNTTHPTFAAMRSGVDARRDEKIQLEQTALLYKTKNLETNTLAERSIQHSQYFQKVRDTRERFMDNLNATFTSVQRERRQWKARDPHYTHLFNPKRSTQVKHQQAYNKEVSLLAGIARHAGFPAAPELSGASSADIEDDLKKIRVNPQRASVVAQIANSNHVNEMAGEDEFLARNPWARSQPVVQRTTVQGNPPTPQPGGQPFATPVNRLRVSDVNQSSMPSSSTVGVASDPPSSVRVQNSMPARSGESPSVDPETRNFNHGHGIEPSKPEKDLSENDCTPYRKPGFHPHASYDQRSFMPHKHGHDEATNKVDSEDFHVREKQELHSSNSLFWRRPQEDAHQFKNGGLDHGAHTHGAKAQGVGV